MQRRQFVKCRWWSLRFAILIGAAAVAPLDAQQAGMNHPVTPPAAQAVPRAGAIHIDGRLDEAAWNAATPVTQFIQSDTRLVRRDQAEDGTDLFEVIFDTFYDHQGRTRLQLNPSGVRNDALGSGQLRSGSPGRASRATAGHCSARGPTTSSS